MTIIIGNNSRSAVKGAGYHLAILFASLRRGGIELKLKWHLFIQRMDTTLNIVLAHVRRGGGRG